MSTGSNKEGLLKFLVHEWSTNHAYAKKIGICVLYVTHGTRCTKLNAFEGRMTATDAVDLHSTQEEADTRMFLHAFHASADGKSQHCSIFVRYRYRSTGKPTSSSHSCRNNTDKRAQGVDRV